VNSKDRLSRESSGHASVPYNRMGKCAHADFTVSMCALHLSKAFDRMNHHARFIKLKTYGK